jgi:lysophospholipase L1-like esterase
MKKLERLKRIIVTTFTLGASLGSIEAQAKTMAPTFKAPLIVGASVSGGYAAEGPGTVLSKRYTEARNVRTIAYNGTPGHVVLKNVPSHTLKDHSIVIGVDLFFWDSIYPTGQASVAALKKLVQAAEEARIPLVLGDIPDLIPGFQSQRALLNQELKAACTRYKQCYLVPLSEVFQQIQKDRHLVYNSKRYTIRELLPDGLHLGPVASAYIADMIETMIVARS